MIPVPPSGKAVAVAALKQALPGVAVSTRMPTTRPDRHVIVSRIGGGARTFATSDPRFLVECYARDELAAEQLALEVEHAWKHLRSHGINYASSDDNVAENPSPDPNHYRVQFTGTLQIIL